MDSQHWMKKAWFEKPLKQLEENSSLIIQQTKNVGSENPASAALVEFENSETLVADPEPTSSNMPEISELLKDINELNKGKTEVVLECFGRVSKVEAEDKILETEIPETQLEDDVALVQEFMNLMLNEIEMNEFLNESL